MGSDSKMFNDTDSLENHDDENDDDSNDEDNSDSPFVELTHIPDEPSTHRVNESDSDEIEDELDDDDVFIERGERLSNF